MQKTIKILSVISLCIILLSIVGLLVGYAFWTPLAELLYGQELEPSVPASSAFSLFMALVASVLMMAFAGQRKTGIWAEIVTVAWCGLGSTVAGLWWMLQPLVLDQLLFRHLGADAYSLYSASNSIASLLWSVATVLNGVSISLTLLVCGLSVVYKLRLKKQSQASWSEEMQDHQQSDLVQ